MKIWVDTRQKEGKHENIDSYFKENNIEVEPFGLNIGDYMLSLNGKISVDTKQDLYEIASDFFSLKEKARFQRQCKRAKAENITLYILIEQDMTKERLLNWKSRKKADGTLITKVTGNQIYSTMQLYSIVFGIKWRFCKKSETGRKIIELLGEK